MPIGQLELNSSQIERIMIARAIYSDRELIVMDDPFSQLFFSEFDKHILDDVLKYFKSIGTTIVMASQNEHVSTI